MRHNGGGVCGWLRKLQSNDATGTFEKKTSVSKNKTEEEGRVIVMEDNGHEREERDV